MQIEQFLTRLDVKRFPCYDFVFTQGDLLKSAYIVKSGQVALSIVNRDGEETIVDVLGRGEMFGDQFLLLGVPAIVSAQITPYWNGKHRDNTPACIYVISKDCFQSLLSTTLFLTEYNKFNTERQVKLWYQLSFKNGDAKRRVILAITYLKNRGLHINQVMIASMCNSTRENVNRILHNHDLRVEYGN